jgi:hypothetical protein
VAIPKCAELFCRIVHAIVERQTLDADLFLELGLFPLLQAIEAEESPAIARVVNHVVGALLVRGLFEFPNVTFARMLASARRLCTVDADATTSALWLASLCIEHGSIVEFANSDAGQFFLDEYTDLPLILRLEVAMLIWELIAASPADAGWFFEEADLAAKTLEICVAADDELALRVLVCAGELLHWMEIWLPTELGGVLTKFAEHGGEFVEWADECEQLSRDREIVSRSRELANAIGRDQLPAVSRL